MKKEMEHHDAWMLIHNCESYMLVRNHDWYKAINKESVSGLIEIFGDFYLRAKKILPGKTREKLVSQLLLAGYLHKGESGLAGMDAVLSHVVKEDPRNKAHEVAWALYRWAMVAESYEEIKEMVDRELETKEDVDLTFSAFGGNRHLPQAKGGRKARILDYLVQANRSGKLFDF